ncbi:MAG: hypothetical protein JWM32_2902 [Verrucomicrobia bacterium]|nr:hypothetical protein [Verrucomicrobiota bacterium]
MEVEDEDYEIGVRSGIDDAEKHHRDHDRSYSNDMTRRARRYQLASAKQLDGEERLWRTVDARDMAAEVKKQLDSQGFHEVQKGEKPELIVTVFYGRTYLNNPYTDTMWDKIINNLSDSDVVSVWPSHQSYHRLEERRQKAALEKLVIMVIGWQYPPPPDPKKKPKMLWRTTMYVGAPDFRDLGKLYQKMLASGAPYFDEHVERESEVIIDPHLPEGNVRIGTPEVVSYPANDRDLPHRRQ